MTVIFGNNTCLFRCPIDYPYVFNNMCVNRCPKESAYVVSKDSKYNRLHCSAECPQMMFNHNLTCVEKCPYGTVIDNKMCRSQCSKHRPYSCFFQNNNPCSVDIHEVAQKQTICRELCPKNMFTLDMTCVSNCPSGYKYLNATCVYICPNDFPFVYNNSVTEDCDTDICVTVTVRLTCTKSCPDSMYKMNQMCLPACPDGLFTVSKTCKIVCPKMLHLKRHTHIPYEKYDLVKSGWSTYWRKQNIQVGIIECVTACRKNEWILNSTCMDTCPNNTFFVNRTCISECPHTFNFIIQRTTVIKCSLYYMCEKLYRYWECLLECPPGTYQFNSTCVYECPHFTFKFGNSCVNECPEAQRFLLQSKRTVSRWIQVGWFQKRLSKVNHTVNAGFICLKSCPPDKKIYNFTCYDQCPAQLFLNGNKCVKECPPENPYKYKGNVQWSCIRYCNDKESFFHNGRCTKNCPLPLIGYDGLCTDKCPDGFIWWYEDCSRNTVAVIWFAVTFGIDIILLILGKDILKEYFTVLHMALRMKTHQTEMTKGRIEENITKKLSNNTGQFRFGKKTLVLAVSGISLTFALGYFAFFKLKIKKN
ncbi:proprotein convertase subtilisin/kexin type 5-like [Ruditapes philippinarum]|uniref:proprotein convertase subtilisin/kexin type 5-like n=1 Tax=Ruditapes philippinarum TaxID=129788 RepID=UPI00295A93AB|nr:proprotein convertase subtilisin/kexin type 5-like [Ruditapes philippinarum]